MSRIAEPKTASYLLRLSPSERERWYDIAAERGTTFADLIRRGLEREEAAHRRITR